MKKRQVKLIAKQPIDDKLKRINLKSKRKRTLINKVIEFSQMCNLGILMIIHDAEMNKVIEYNSGSITEGKIFSMKDAIRVQKAACQNTMGYKYYTDDAYKNLIKGSKCDVDNIQKFADIIPNTAIIADSSTSLSKITTIQDINIPNVPKVSH